MVEKWQTQMVVMKSHRHHWMLASPVWLVLPVVGTVFGMYVVNPVADVSPVVAVGGIVLVVDDVHPLHARAPAYTVVVLLFPHTCGFLGHTCPSRWVGGRRRPSLLLFLPLERDATSLWRMVYDQEVTVDDEKASSCNHDELEEVRMLMSHHPPRAM